ncbi:hypothetical protein [Methanopyrus sp.]
MSFKPALVITLASLIAVSPVHADKLVIITGYWSTGIPAAKAASGFPVTVIVEDAVSKGLVSEDLVRKEVESADTLLLIHTTSNTVLENILNEVISESKKRVFEFDNVLPVPSDAKELNQIKVDWHGLKIPLSMYVQSRSVRNFRSLLSYLLNGHPGPYHLFDGWIEGYDPFRDEIIRPSDPDPEEVADLIRRYGSKTVTLGHTRYPVWFVELLRKHLPRAVAEVMNKVLDISNIISGITMVTASVIAEHLSTTHTKNTSTPPYSMIQILRLILSHDASKIEKERIPCVLIIVDTTRLESGWTAPFSNCVGR